MSLEKPSIPEVLDLFVAYLRRNPSWGRLHAVLEDGNVSDAAVRSAIDDANSSGDKECAELGRILLSMTKSQRVRLPEKAKEEVEES